MQVIQGLDTEHMGRVEEKEGGDGASTLSA